MFNEWWLTRDSCNPYVYAYPTKWTGIKKYKGCCVYRPDCNLSTPSLSGGKTNNTWGFELSPISCKKAFGHCPKEGELLCVKKTRTGWKAEKYELEFEKEK